MGIKHFSVSIKSRGEVNVPSVPRFLSLSPGFCPQVFKVGRFESYAINRTKLEGGVLSIYLWFDDSGAQVLTAYLLNDEPAARKFKTIDEYRNLRDRFLQKLSGCDLH